jgi:nicotinate phosphoribosyltransferase
MAHSYVQAHDDETDAFRRFAELYPNTILLVDTYETLEGVRKVVALSRAMGDRFRVRGLRLDSGDLLELSREARRILDEAGLRQVEIFASGGLDEDRIAELVAAGAPIAGFGVGTAMGTSRDAPALDIAYKLTSFAGKGAIKLSPGKWILPGRKQVFRVEEAGRAVRDVLALADEPPAGRPLLRKVMERGAPVTAGADGLEEARTRAREEIARLPERIRALAPAEPAYPVEISAALGRYRDTIALERGGALERGR